MEWYYANGNERLGPISDADMAELARSGKISPETLVWRQGFTDWQPWGEAGGAAAPTPRLATPAGPAAPAAAAAACVECGKRFPMSEMLQYGGSWVCPTCKPVFVQKMKEGVSVGHEMHYAGFWIRFAAKFVDGIILQVVNIPIRLFMGNMSTDPQVQMKMVFLGVGLSLLLSAAYMIFFVGKFGATPGKMALRLRIVTSSGDEVGYGRACGRYFAEFLSSITLCIGYIMAAFDEQKRALHDHVCDTRVIRTNV